MRRLAPGDLQPDVYRYGFAQPLDHGRHPGEVHADVRFEQMAGIERRRHLHPSRQGWIEDAMMKLLRIRRDERGAGAVEFALSAPVLITLIYGIFEMSQLYEANAGMQHAL